MLIDCGEAEQRRCRQLGAVEAGKCDIVGDTKPAVGKRPERSKREQSR